MARLALDRTDLAILTVLCTEGRIAKAELARRVNLSATPCWQRLARMEAAGLVRGYRAEVDLAVLAPHVTVFVTVELDTHKAETFQLFERTVGRIDEITGCWALGGGYDYLLEVVARDVASYQALMDSLLESRAGVKRYYSYIVTKRVKNAPPPIASLLDGSS